MYILEGSRIGARSLEHAWPWLSAGILLFGRSSSETPKYCLFLSQSSVIEHAPSSLQSWDDEIVGLTPWTRNGFVSVAV
jgi:hypothetical protein